MLELNPVGISGIAVRVRTDNPSEQWHVICDDGSHYSLNPDIIAKETGQPAPFVANGSRIVATAEGGINIIRKIEAVTPPQHSTVTSVDNRQGHCTIRLADSGASYMAPLSHTIGHRVRMRFNASGARKLPLHDLVGDVRLCKDALVAFHLDLATAVPQDISVISRPRAAELRDELKHLPAALALILVSRVAVPAVGLGLGAAQSIGNKLNWVRNRLGGYN